MIIANPIYDSVFKYLLEDLNVAKIMLSALIEEEIVDLEVRPQEMVAEIDGVFPERSKYTGYPFTIYRLDFAAKIKKHNGKEEVLLVELQKAHLLTDIYRFRKYLGEQLASKNNMREEQVAHKLVVPVAISIRPIYILGHELEVIRDRPVIKIIRSCIDAATQEVIKEQDPFIEALTHDAIVVCVKALEGNQRNELERMLNIFNQKLVMENGHFITIDEKSYPAKFQPILRRLNMATQDATVKQQMETEDVILDELRLWDINLQILKETAEKAKAELDEAKTELVGAKAQVEDVKTELGDVKTELGDVKTELGDVKTELGDVKTELGDVKAQVEKERREKQALLSRNIKSAQVLIKQGIDENTVANAFGISLATLEEWMESE